MNAKAAQNFRDRLKIAAGRAGGVDELAKAAGIARRTFGNYLSGRNEPKRPQLLAIARASGVSVSWLASGDGPMSAAEPTAEIRHDSPGMGEAAAPPSFLAAPALSSEGFALLPRHDVRAPAGGGVLRSPQVVDVLAFRADWIRHTLGLDPGDLALIAATGDSMRPTIKHGDLLLLDLTAGHVRDDAIYALDVGGALLVRRIQALAGGGMRVISDNPAYPPEELAAHDAGHLRILGRVVWHGAPI